MGCDDLLNKIENIITETGADSYLGEDVTMEQHMLQTALLTETEDGSDSVIAGGLLHDIGHYSEAFAEDALEQGLKNYHEDSGAQILGGTFPVDVMASVKLHVSAKRYLCATDTNYFNCLSELRYNY